MMTDILRRTDLRKCPSCGVVHTDPYALDAAQLEGQLCDENERLRKQVQELKETLKYYESPFDYCQERGLDELTPDFYDETGCGNRATIALAKLEKADA